MEVIRQVAKLVEHILIQKPKTRNSDSYLYYTICGKKLKENGFDISKVTLADALLNREKYGLPNYETVRRARQKIQAMNPSLQGCKEVEEMRAVQEESFREYARS